MKINNIGYNHRHDADFFVSRPNGSGDCLLLLIKTPALFTLNGEEIEAPANSFILFREGTPQLYRAKGAEFSNDWFHFSLENEDFTLLKALDIPFDTIIPIGDMSNLSMLIKSMSYEQYSSNLYRTDSIELYLKLFFIKLGEKLSPQNESYISSHYDRMSIVRSKIYSMPQNEWNINGLAHEMVMSKSHFEHMYKQIFGVSAMSDVITSRIEHAKFLLSTTDVPVNQIAEMCGYKSDIHFMRQFKSRMGTTPSKYRQTNKEDTK